MLSAKSAQFEMHLLNRFEALGTSSDSDIDAESSKITTTIMETALETVGREASQTGQAHCRNASANGEATTCLLYTSDAADE